MNWRYLAGLFTAVPAAAAIWIIADKSTQCAEWRHYAAIKDDIRDQLKAPSTAEFAPLSDTVWRDRDFAKCGFEVTGYVDAQNSFGAPIRHDFSAMTLSGTSGPEVMTAQISSR